MKKAWALVAALAMLPAAHADIFGYVDEKGIAHFAAEKIDERYQLFFRGGQGFDTSQELAAPAAPATRGAPPRLLALFEAAPGFSQIRQHLREAARAHAIDYELLQALIATESGFDSGAVSPKGAIGLMQVMPATAERYGLSGDRNNAVEKKLADPRTNIRTGTRYLSYLMQLFPGQLELALAAYNAGEGAVQRAGNRIPNYRETQNYVKTVMQLYVLLKPAPVPVAAGRPPTRIRMEFGGAVGRGNMPAGTPLSAANNEPSLRRD
ncbi:MAG: lytic transglycosylase domain-containing protein [Ramlibacter sp.]|nr:lytic transglycosylase domain-containing protein [Ramlibacter sp.]